MDDGLKQRLIGAFVLLALGVIFIPVFFDRERIEPVDKRTQIPPIPHIEPIEIESAVAPEIDSVAEAPREMYIPDDKVEETLEPEPMTVNNDGVPNSWVLQIGSFRFEKHAEKFRDTLISEGYASYTRTVETGKGKMTRVFVGPKLDKTILIQQKKAIEKKHNVSAMLLKFKP